MQDEPTAAQPLTRPEVSDAMRLQILATEHWSLLATRSMTWNEMFTRASMFLTVLSPLRRRHLRRSYLRNTSNLGSRRR